MNTLDLPDISNNITFEVLEGKGVTKLSHSDCLSRVNEFVSSSKLNYNNIVNSAPVSYPSNFNLGLIGALSTKSYSIYPGSYNFNNILKMIETNKSSHLVCEDSLMDIRLSKEKLKDLRNITEMVKEILVLTNEETLKQKNIEAFKEIFVNANLNFYSENTFSKI